MQTKKSKNISLMLKAVHEYGLDKILDYANLKFDFSMGKNSSGNPICIARSEINLDKLPVEVFTFMIDAMSNHRVALVNLKSDGNATNHIRIQHNLSEDFVSDLALQKQVKEYTMATIKKAMDAELKLLMAARKEQSLSEPFRSNRSERPGFFERLLGSSGIKTNPDVTRNKASESLATSWSRK